MDPFEKTRGGFEVGIERLKRQRDLIIRSAEGLVPTDSIDMLATVGETDFPLEWVTVPDPRNANATLEVLPSLYLWEGDDENELGLYHIIVSTKINDEETPLFSIDAKEQVGSTGICRNGFGELPWDSVDTELMLNLAEYALMAQSK